MPKLTKEFVFTVTRLLSQEEQSIWELGDFLAAAPLTEAQYEELALKVDRSRSTLKKRARLAAMFPADQWDRNVATWGVFAELAAVDDPVEMRRLLRSRKSWTNSSMKNAVHRLLHADPALTGALDRLTHARSSRTMTLATAEFSLLAQVELLDDGYVELRLNGVRIPEGHRIRHKLDDGDTLMKIPIEVLEQVAAAAG